MKVIALQRFLKDGIDPRLLDFDTMNVVIPTSKRKNMPAIEAYVGANPFEPLFTPYTGKTYVTLSRLTAYELTPKYKRSIYSVKQVIQVRQEGVHIVVFLCMEVQS